MHCPICNTQDTKVIDSRMLLEGQTVRRRRKCQACEHRFTTYEKIHIQIPTIVKNDGRRENFNRDSIIYFFISMAVLVFCLMYWGPAHCFGSQIIR